MQFLEVTSKSFRMQVFESTGAYINPYEFSKKSILEFPAVSHFMICGFREKIRKPFLELHADGFSRMTFIKRMQNCLNGKKIAYQGKA